VHHQNGRQNGRVTERRVTWKSEGGILFIPGSGLTFWLWCQADFPRKFRNGQVVSILQKRVRHWCNDAGWQLYRTSYVSKGSANAGNPGEPTPYLGSLNTGTVNLSDQPSATWSRFARLFCEQETRPRVALQGENFPTQSIHDHPYGSTGRMQHSDTNYAIKANDWAQAVTITSPRTSQCDILVLGCVNSDKITRNNDHPKGALYQYIIKADGEEDNPCRARLQSQSDVYRRKLWGTGGRSRLTCFHRWVVHETPNNAVCQPQALTTRPRIFHKDMIGQRIRGSGWDAGDSNTLPTASFCHITRY